ncbi:MAG: hypothetical protein ACYDDO_08190 [Acidiferrobacterales bacterium]
MDNPILNVPGTKPLTGKVEMSLRETQDWLASLPLADSFATAQQLYRALYGLNRHDVDFKDRLELMELYAQPVASVSEALQTTKTHLNLPLNPKARQLSEFLQKLHTEMAYGYKYVIRDLSRSRNLWGKKPAPALAAERAIHHLGEMLLRCYQVYMPYPAGVWREIHTLYHLVEQSDALDDSLSGSREGTGARVAVRSTYLRVVLLGLCGPYQLPQDECINVNAFLFSWAGKASIGPASDIADPVGHFLVDLTADSPAMLFPKDVKLKAAPYLRALSTIGLARTVHDFINQLKNGKSPRLLNIGTDCIDVTGADMLRRMVRFWGLAARRQYSRRARHESQLSVCVGLKALHFFSSGQKPFAPPEAQSAESAAVPIASLETGGDVAFIDLDTTSDPLAQSIADPMLLSSAGEMYRTVAWRIRDESAAGLSLLYRGGGAVVRVGDLLGIHDPDSGAWRVGVARWLKSPVAGELEMGVEMLAPAAFPAAVQLIGDGTSDARYVQALRLGATPALHQPATLLLDRGMAPPGRDLYLLDGTDRDAPRRVRIMKLIERTGSFEQSVFVDVRRPVP